MEEPAKKRRRIVVGALSPNRTRILVHKINKQAMWDLPDSHIHWGVGKKLKSEPFLTACNLLNDATLGILGDAKKIQQGMKTERKILPTGGFIYIFENLQDDQTGCVPLNFYVDALNNVKRHLGMKEFQTELHEISEIKDEKAHLKYGSITIETIRSIL